MQFSVCVCPITTMWPLLSSAVLLLRILRSGRNTLPTHKAYYCRVVAVTDAQTQDRC